MGTDELSDAQIDRVRQLLNSNSDDFAQAGEHGITPLVEIEIDTGQHALFLHLPPWAPHER